MTVKLQAYDEASNSYTDTTYGTATIPFADLVTGNFSINVGANTIPDGTKVVLVSYSPNGKHAVMGDPLFLLAYLIKINTMQTGAPSTKITAPKPRNKIS